MVTTPTVTGLWFTPVRINAEKRAGEGALAA